MKILRMNTIKVFYKFWLVSSIFAICSSKSLSRTDEVNVKIVGGFETTIAKNPWQSSLRFGNLHFCAGSIITEKWILSAASCDANEVRVGSSYHESMGYIITVNRIVRHPNFIADKSDYDFALLELNDPLNFTSSIRPIALPESNTEIEDGTMCLVTGWGLTMNETESRDQLRAIHLPIVNQQYCSKQYQNAARKITDRMICAEGGKGPSQLDFGDPLVAFQNGIPKLIGVYSYGGAGNYSGVYSRITSVRQWISSITGI